MRPIQRADHVSEADGALTIRLMRADDDLDAELDLRHRAFGPMDDALGDFWRAEVLACIADSRQFGVWDGGQLVGTGRYHDMRQWWHGRALPMAGVGGVKVAPEVRGRGVGRALMTHLLGAMAERGYALSALYPATAHIYRSLGWEMAGGHYRVQVPGRSLAQLLPPDPELPVLAAAEIGQVPGAGRRRPAVRRAVPDDADEVIAVLGAIHAASRDCGPCTFDAGSVRRWLADPDMFAYLAADGVLAYGWQGSDREIMVEVLQAGSPQTARALWGIIASNASVTEVVRATVGPADPVGWLTREPDVSLRQHGTWMLRLLDPASAISGRGYPVGARASVQLLLADPELAANAGPRTLSVSDGEGTLTAGITARGTRSPTSPPVRLGPRGFAALFAGVPMSTLRVAGLAAGGDRRTDDALDGVFAGRPYLLDYF